MTSLMWQGGASVAAPALRLMLRQRVQRGKELAARLPEREGIDTTPRPPGRLMWIHAASVGESLSVLSVLPFLQEVTVLLTTGTVTSAALLAGRLPALETGRVMHRFVPLDVPAWAARFLDHWQPNAAAFVESELWPNTLAACQARRIPLMLINARMSERSFRGWSRAPRFARHVLGAFTQVQAQSAADAARLSALGARCVTAPGDLKLAAPPLEADPDALVQLRYVIGDRPVWLAASTHPGEEAMASTIHRLLAPAYPGLLTIIAPRHPDRGPAIEPSAPHRSAGQGPEGGIWVVDTLGELGLLYRLTPIVFVGRSLVAPGGGQNPWEPAKLGCVVAVGPHTGNFEPAVQKLRAAGVLSVVPDAAGLAAWVEAMLSDPARVTAAGQAARAVASGLSDLPKATAQSLLALLP